MKILHIIASIDPAGGGPIEGVVRHNEACAELHIVGTRELVTLDPPESPLLADFPMKVHALGRRRTGSRLPWRRALEHYGYTPDLVPWLKANIARFDVVIVNGLWNYAPFAASRVLPGGRIPYFVFPHGMMDPWFRRTYPLKHFAKQLFWLVGEGRLLAGANSVFFTCEEERLQAQGEFPLHNYKEIVVGYGAAAPPPRSPRLEAAFRAAVPRLNDRPYLLFLSRIHAKKGCDLLVEAFARVAADHPSIDLVIAGPDQTGQRPALEALAARRGVANRIHWTGPLYGDSKWGALHSANAFVLPSHQENFGIAVAEALGCGVPVLISDKVNIWREIDAAGAGLVEPDTIDGAESLLRRWFATGPDVKSTMRKQAVELFQRSFDIGIVWPQLLRTIKLYM